MFWEAQIKPTHIEWFFRGFVPFFWLLLLAKVMGQRLMGRLTLFDFIIAISIGSVMASIMGNPKENLLSGFILTGAFALGNVLLSFLVLHFGKLRRLVQGEPLVLIKDGRILDDVLRSNRVTLDDLLVSLRLNSIANPLDVEYAIMEPNGQISVMPKSQQRPVRPADLGLKMG